MSDEVLMSNLQEDTVTDGSCGLTKNEVIKLLFNSDSSVELIAPEKFKSPIWERFRLVFYKGVKQNFVQCVGCSLVLVYKSRTGTASLLRHRCSRFPISVYDLKQSFLASHNPSDVMNEMATSSSNNNGSTIELKQEMMSDEEIDAGSFEEQDEDQQTDKGLMESFSILEKTFMTGDELLLTREEIETAKRSNDPDIYFERPRNHRHSTTWDRFEIVYYRNCRQNFAKCLSCSSIVSYKKTTGTASLIRHKCKNQPNVKVENVKMESLASLLVVSQQLPPLTPAPSFSPQPQSSSSPSVSVSSTSTLNKTSQVQPTSLIRTYCRPDNHACSNAEKCLINAQIQWLSQSLISTEILGDSTYLNFLQSLINFGAEYGKQKVTNFINRSAICHEMIPQMCKRVQSELMSALKETEFSISYCTWSNVKDEKYVTVFVYYFNNEFEYKNAILGTRKCIEHDTVEIVKEITKMYQSSSENLKCVTEKDIKDFETYPCIISRISKMILKAMNASEENKNFFKKIYQKAHEVLKFHPKASFEECSDNEKLKIFYELYDFSKESEPPVNSIIKKFTNIFGTLFSAISSLTETSEHGSRCVTANRIYLWCKKFLKYYSEFYSDDKLINNIGSLLLKLIKENFTDSICEIYQIAVFLNPNFKSLKFLTLLERNALLDIVKKNLQKLMNDDGDGETSQPVQKKQKIAKNQTHVNDTFFEFMDITMESLDDQVNSEIQCYMGFKLENPVDIVEFWRTTDCFPYLKKLARNYLNLPSCTFHGNCCFLSAGNEFYQKCRHLPADDTENLTFLHQNL